MKRVQTSGRGSVSQRRLATHLPLQIFTCDQLLTYLRSFTAVKEEVKAEAKAVEVPAGLKPFKREEVVDEMFTGVPKKAAPPKKVGWCVGGGCVCVQGVGLQQCHESQGWKANQGVTVGCRMNRGGRGSVGKGTDERLDGRWAARGEGV